MFVACRIWGGVGFLFCCVGGRFGLFVVGWFVCGVWLLFVWVVVDLLGRVGVGWVGLCWVVVFGGVVLLKLASSLAVGSSLSVSDSDVTSVSWL
jgi:hypothetical protein